MQPEPEISAQVRVELIVFPFLIVLTTVTGFVVSILIVFETVVSVLGTVSVE